MITYELAKELKDAGFPQGDSFENVIAHGTAMAYLRESKPSDELLEKYEKSLRDLKEMYEDDNEWVYQPTLSELIEACGDKFGGISRAKHPIKIGQWAAYVITAIEFNDMVGGSTPEEAVANLWLQLNKKSI